MLKFLRVVQNCTAELSDGEIIILGVLATEADYKTGRGSRPGIARMRKASRRSERGVQFILKSLRSKKLIELTSKGDGGRGLASIYRICLENPAFPDPEENPAVVTAPFST
jgi:hypothetical protein